MHHLLIGSLHQKIANNASSMDYLVVIENINIIIILIKPVNR